MSENNKKHILLVEDNLTAVKAARMIFEKYGHEVDHASDGEQAIEMVQTNRYDGIYMDIGLPTISGIEVCRAIRDFESKNNLQTVPIIAVTGNSSPEESKEYKDAGMQEVIVKPLTFENAKLFLSFCK